MVGCSADAGCQARKRTPATNLAERAGRMQRQGAAVAGDDIAVAGHAPLHLAPARAPATNPHSAPCRRPRLSSPSTCQGSSAWRSSRSHAAVLDVADQREAEFEMRREPVGFDRQAGRLACRPRRPAKSSQMKCGSMKRSCSSVPQRTSLACRASPRTGRRGRAAGAAAPGSSARAAAFRRSGTRRGPAGPVGPSGE